MGSHQGGEGARSQQGRVPRQYHEVVELTVVLVERRQGYREGVACPPLDGLFDHVERGPRGTGFSQGLGHPRRPVADDDDHLRELEPGQRAEDPHDHGTPAQAVQWLGPGAMHTGAFPRRQHHSRQLGLIARRRLAR